MHPHYTGSIVLFQENTTTSTLPTYSVIDGQQRLTTFQLFIAAFREACRKKVRNESLIRDLNKLLFNEESFGDTDYQNQKFKLEPTKFNRDAFRIIIDKTYDEVVETLINPVLQEYGVGPKSYWNVAKKRYQVLAAYLFFHDQLMEYINKEESVEGWNAETDMKQLITRLLFALKRDFQFVEIGLTANDDPQMIFETMNGRGASLTETDLIRNYIFMRANGNEENLERIYATYWDEFDDPEADYPWHDKMGRGRFYGSRLQFFIIDYLTLKLRKDIRSDQAFYHYKSYIKNDAQFESVEEELKELNRLSAIFKKITQPEGNRPFAKLSRRMLDMNFQTIYPLMLSIESDTMIVREEKDKIYGYLDSYMTRRFICGLTPKNYNNVFMEYLKFLDTNKSADEFKSLLLSKTADTNLWPSDNMLLEKIMDRPIYREERNKSRTLSNILLEVEHHSRGRRQEQVIFVNDGLTIEHLMPQKWHEHWPLNGEQVSEEDFELAKHAVMTESDPEGKYHKIENRNKALHSFGNLTILTNALNPSVSNSSYSTKKREITRQSTLLINAYFQDKEVWNESGIKERAKVLYDSVIQIWKHG